ncbi:MAG: hypothetical protein LBU65_02295, partial [Planctomycetaceae bacterium]|nr:hypothetical protein [Planctomycetaceae bacterium]
PVSASSYCSTPSNYYWWEVGVGFVSGLKTGGKAVVNGLVAAAKQAVTLNLYEKYEGVFTYTEQDIANGAQLSEGIANASGSILIGAGTGWAGCAGGKVGQAVKAFDMASDAVGAAQSIEDIHDNGLNATNALGLIGSTGGLATNGLSACFTEGTQIVIGVEYPAELCSCEIICADYHSEDCGVFYVTTNIENIKVGDYVLAQDVETGEVSLKEVTDTFVRTSDHLRYLTTIDEEGDTQTIETTDGHPFWVVTDNPDLSRAAGDFVVENGTILYHENLAITEHGYYVEAKDLRVGDVFLGANGELTTLTGTERVEFPNGVTVYNFTVADNHNYYVIANLEAYENGASVVLVHNASGIYEFFDKKNAGKKYVGQASDLDARLKQHKAAGRIEDIKDAIKTEMPESDKLAREIAEHNRIQELTNGMPSRFSDSVSNKRDPIGPARIHLLNEGGSI